MKLILSRLRSGYQQAGVLARAVVAKRVTILAGGGIVLGELVRNGIIPDGVSSGVTHSATVGFSVLGVVAGVLWAHAGATPADPELKPKDKYGNPLVSARSTGPHDGLSIPVAPESTASAEPSTSPPSAAAALSEAAAINPRPS